MLQKPAGILLFSFIFAMAAAVSLGAGSFLVLLFIMIRRAPPVTMQPGFMYPTAQPAFGVVMVGLIAVLSFVGAWATGSAVGLWKLKRWGLLSARAFAGIITIFGLLLLFSALIQIPLSSSMRGTPGFNPHAAEVFLIVVSSGAGIFIPLGSWMLFYLTRHRIQSMFLYPIALEVQLAPKPRVLPRTFTVLAWLLLLGAPIAVVYAFSHLPILLFGFVVQGTYAALTYAVYAVVSTSLGFGLLARKYWARFGTMAFATFGIANNLFFLLPTTRLHFATYIAILQARTANHLGTTAAHSHATFLLHPHSFWASLVFSLFVGCWVIYKLHHHRHLFR